MLSSAKRKYKTRETCCFCGVADTQAHRHSFLPVFYVCLWLSFLFLATLVGCPAASSRKMREWQDQANEKTDERKWILARRTFPECALHGDAEEKNPSQTAPGISTLFTEPEMLHSLRAHCRVSRMHYLLVARGCTATIDTAAYTPMSVNRRNECRNPRIRSIKWWRLTRFVSLILSFSRLFSDRVARNFSIQSRIQRARCVEWIKFISVQFVMRPIASIAFCCWGEWSRQWDFLGKVMWAGLIENIIHLHLKNDQQFLGFRINYLWLYKSSKNMYVTNKIFSSSQNIRREICSISDNSEILPESKIGNRNDF